MMRLLVLKRGGFNSSAAAAASPLEFIFSEFRFFMPSILLPYTHLDLLFSEGPFSYVKSPKRCRGIAAVPLN